MSAAELQKLYDAEKSWENAYYNGGKTKEAKRRWHEAREKRKAASQKVRNQKKEKV